MPAKKKKDQASNKDNLQIFISLAVTFILLGIILNFSPIFLLGLVVAFICLNKYFNRHQKYINAWRIIRMLLIAILLLVIIPALVMLLYRHSLGF